jgi:5-methylcytosine-specific restriction endonuclease McrA
LLHQDDCPLTHHIEHVVARKHGGTNDDSNLALACHRCNLHKGPNLTGVDRSTHEIVPLFHPRHDQWLNHFEVRGARIEGKTAIGRATVRVLAMNDARRIELRAQILAR